MPDPDGIYRGDHPTNSEAERASIAAAREALRRGRSDLLWTAWHYAKRDDRTVKYTDEVR